MLIPRRKITIRQDKNISVSLNVDLKVASQLRATRLSFYFPA